MFGAAATQSSSERLDVRRSERPAKALSKSKAWPRPNFKALHAKGYHLPQLMVIRQVYALLPSKPQASFHEAASRYADAIQSIRNAALSWLEDVRFDTAPRMTPTFFQEAWASILTRAFGRPASNDPCYFTRRHVVDHLGCQIYALFGDSTPFKRLPNPKQVERMSTEISRGWPATPPPWERRGLFMVGKAAVSLESRGQSTFARWSNSLASDRGVFQTFSCREDADEWFESLSPVLVFSEKGSTRLVSTHESTEAARAALLA